jgi:hypothetical protein
MTNNKQQPQEEIQDSKLLLRRFELMEDCVNQVRKTNLDNGLDLKRMDNFIQWEAPFKRKQYDKWLKATTNPKTGKFYTLSGLREAGVISEEEEEQFEEKTYPHRKLYQLHRVKTPSGEEYLQRLEQWIGLSRVGGVVTVSVNDIDYWVRPKVTYSYEPEDPQNREGKQIRVGSIRGDHFGQDPPASGSRIYLTRYSPKKAQELLANKVGEIGDVNHGTGLTLIKVNAPNPIGVTLNEFLAPSFDEIWEHKSQPAPVIHIDSKALMKDIMSAESQKQYQ